MAKEKRCQLSFDIQSDIRQEIKIHAAKRGISMNLWIMRAIYCALKIEGGRKNEQPPSETDER